MTAARWPDPLARNARIGVWAPGGQVPMSHLQRLARGIAVLRGLGYTVEAGRSCTSALGAYPLPPDAIAAELHEMLERFEGVIAAGGGWAVVPTLSYVDWDMVGRAGKPIVGHGELTSVLNLTVQRGGLVAFHGPMVMSEWAELSAYTASEFDQVVSSGRDWRARKVPSSGGHADGNLLWDTDNDRNSDDSSGSSRDQVLRTVRPGEASGPLWGGSLAPLSLLLGTPLWPQPDYGSIVFLRVDNIPRDLLRAYLDQLRQAGVFQRAGAVLVGKINNSRRSVFDVDDFDQIFRAIVRVPIVTGFDLGPGRPMSTLAVGGKARLTCPIDGRPQLVLERELTSPTS